MSKSTRLWSGRYVAIVLMAFLFFVCVQLLTAGFPAYITEVKNNPAQGGLMTTVFMLAAIVTRPLIGYLIHKMNMKVMSLAGLVFVAVTIGFSYGQESVPLLLFLRALHGIGFGILSTILSTMATNIIPASRLGEGIGYYGLATSVGTSLAPMIALSLLQLYSYNLLIIVSIVLTIATLIISFFTKAQKKVEQKSETKREVAFKEYAFDKKAFLPCLLTVFFTVSLGGVISFLNELGKEANIEGSVAFFFLIVSIVMAAVRPFSGRIFDNYGHKVIIYPAAASGIIGLFLLAITDNTATLLIAAFFYGIAYGILTPTLQAIAVSAVRRDKQGTANAMFFSGMDLGVAIGSTGLGLLASYTGYHFIYGFSILFLVVLILLYTFVFVKGESRSHTVERG